MGGGNAQKSAAARAKKLEKESKNKTPEERKAALAKVNADRNGFMCKLCKSTFMINVPPPQLMVHVTAKHPGSQAVECFDELADYDPDDPKGLKKAAAEKAAAEKKVAAKKKKKPEAGLDDLLNAGLAPKGAKPKKKYGK